MCVCAVVTFVFSLLFSLCFLCLTSVQVASQILCDELRKKKTELKDREGTLVQLPIIQLEPSWCYQYSIQNRIRVTYTNVCRIDIRQCTHYVKIVYAYFFGSM